MRRSILSLALVLIPAALAAQGGPIDPGSIVLGGSISFSNAGGDLYENADGDGVTTLTVNPRALFFVKRGLAVGGELVVSRTSQGDFEITTLGIGPAVYYFFGASGARYYPFVGATLAYTETSSDAFDASGLAFGGTAGIAYMLSESIAVTTALSYQVEELEIDGFDESEDGNRLSLDVGIEAFLH